METYEQQIFPIFADTSQYCPQESLASQRVLPGSDEAARMTVGSGRQCSMLLKSSSPIGQFSKILLESSLWTKSQEYTYVWNRSDTKLLRHSLFQLTPLGQSTEDSESSLLPTPVAANSANRENGLINSRGEPCLSAQVKLWRTPNGTGGAMNGERRLEQGHQLNLADQAKTPKLWPTPRAEFDSGKHRGQTDTLHSAAKLWPTPTERDWKSTSPGNQTNSRPLSEVAGLEGKGSLNPEFVEVLMMFPIGHTRLQPNASPIDHTALKP
jgi:hypothetical protein